MEILYNQCKDESLKPDHITYSTILRIYAKSKSKINVARAEEIMEIMENKAKDFACPWPNASVYTSLINIYKNNKIEDMGERSEAVIKRIDQASQTFGSASPKANAFIFGAGRLKYIIYVLRIHIIASHEGFTFFFNQQLVLGRQAARLKNQSRLGTY